ncbi:4-methylaminobutanoate oxidase (formaldehyde-forming) [Pseudooceanicola marinus]|uniref:4-methylaminobutanoate oxidase (Formaldehyde-forming) n=1 Tax=Pseudooceanicola marinus TaxID=396013 RepID=A0A1X6ZNR4_9RHOB|nr:FAD-binding oxidoreductase [Pseudooceanicola marinus]SLN57006.1 4-methylaminobutanoate oxidase (formaldehyde-forming) [Pseudooceanicola marinus]
MILDVLQRIETDTQLPDAADVVIIGGGIAGVTATLFLAEAGLKVVLCEKGVIAGEQSSRNWGWVRQMGRDPVELPLTMGSLDIWRGMDKRFGIDTGFRETGITYVCRTPREVKEFADWADLADRIGMASERLDPAALARKLPAIARDRFKFGLHTKDDGRAEPWRAVPQMAMAARRLGATIIENCAVRGVETSAGHLSEVVTEKGRIRTERAILAGGAWSRMFLGNKGVNFPQLKLHGTVARVEIDGDAGDMPVGGGDFAFRKRLDGGYTVARRNWNVAQITPDSFRLLGTYLPTLMSSWREIQVRLNGEFLKEAGMPRKWGHDQQTTFEKIRTLDPQPMERYNRHALKNLARAFPVFAGARMTHSWAGLIDATPDAIPAIGPVKEIPGLFLSSGYSGHGFGSGPGGGQLVSDLVRGVAPTFDPKPFSLERFTAKGLRPGGAA